MESLKEISEFLNKDTRLDVKAVALQYVLGVTGTTEGQEMLLSVPEILRQLILLLQDESLAIAKDAALCLVNISANEDGASALLIITESSKAVPGQRNSDNLIHLSIKHVMDKESPLADPCCMILSNVTRPTNFADRVITILEKCGFSWDSIVSAFTAKQYNLVGGKLHYLGPLFSNLSQSKRMREFLTKRDLGLIQRLLPFTEYSDSIVRRGGIVGTIRNCCFDIENHEWLLSPEVDLLPYLLLPLAGPEEFDDEDNNKLPIDLQYLPETKTRESDPDIRIMILEALGQLCATRKVREILRENNAYIILRELHKWEKDNAALLACENVVDILINTEEEVGVDNLKEVEVPEKYTEKFKKLDAEFIGTDAQTN